MFVGIPVVQQTSRDQKGVVLMAALAVVPATVVANLCLSMGNSNWTLTPWKNRYVLLEPVLYPVFLVFGLRCIYQNPVKKAHLGHKEMTFSCIICCGPSTLRLSTCGQVKACNICNLDGPERVGHKHVALRCSIFIWDVNQDRLKNKMKLDLNFFFNAGSVVD